MKTKSMPTLPRYAAAFALACAFAQPVAAEPPADKAAPAAQKAAPAGQQTAPPAGGMGREGDVFERAGDHAKSRDAASGQASGKRTHDHASADDPNHGRVVSECNHRANERKLQGQDRKQFTEWCIERGERHQYDDRRYRDERSCYQRADDRRLSGEARRYYLVDCLARKDADRAGDDGKRKRN